MCVFWTGSFQCEDRAIDRAERRKKLGREVNDFPEELPLKWGWLLAGSVSGKRFPKIPVICLLTPG